LVLEYSRRFAQHQGSWALLPEGLKNDLAGSFLCDTGLRNIPRIQMGVKIKERPTLLRSKGEVRLQQHNREEWAGFQILSSCIFSENLAFSRISTSQVAYCGIWHIVNGQYTFVEEKKDRQIPSPEN
jgi:hypothetical protein